MKLRRIIKEYFSFTRGERTGLIVLIILILLVIAAKEMIFYFEKSTVADRKQFVKLVKEHEQRKNVVEPEAGELFAFDPNTVDSLTLSKLNLPKFVKQNVLRYRQHGGHFKRTSDFRRLYGMNDSVFAAIEPFLVVEQPEPVFSPMSKAELKPRFGNEPDHSIVPVDTGIPVASNSIMVELNTSTSSELEKLRGIGPVLSKRIVKYRELLGGFYAIDQLKEVYGIKPEVFEANRVFVSLGVVELRKLDLNFLTVEELAAHPYINYKEAQRIVDFRSKNGYISDKNILLSDSIIGEEHFRKLSYYLK